MASVKKSTQSKKQRELQDQWKQRNQRLQEMNLPKETFEQFNLWLYGRGRVEKSKETYKPNSAIKLNNSGSLVNSASDSVRRAGRLPESFKGSVSSAASQQYTGSQVLGISTMHKSNMVPVFSSEQAQDLAKMRRG